MDYPLTPAAERALTAAAGWTLPTEPARTGTVALLLGLLAEPECRAAAVLARYGIDSEAVGNQWPDVAPLPASAGDSPRAVYPLSADLEGALAAAADRFARAQSHLVLATEHLLLALADAEDDLGRWLRQRGLDPGTLEAEIDRLYGCEAGPLAVPEAIITNPLTLDTSGTGPDLPLSWGEGGDDHTVHTPHLPSQADERSPALPRPTPPRDRVAAIRVLDAAANRGREALRTIEDYVRFWLDDRHLTALSKQLRHDLAAILAATPLPYRLAARETQADVGTGVSTPSETSRADAQELLTANFCRLQEALRSLEEFGKLLDPAAADRLQQLRYRAYTLQRAVQITGQSLQRLARARLYVLVDGRRSVDEFQRLAQGLVEAGVDVLQLRDKRLDDRRLLERARLLRQITAGSGTLFIVNDRPDLAALAGADGLHVGQDELSVKDARAIVGPAALIGVSTHSIQQARQAVIDGADYIGAGPTFPSATKAFEQFPGVELLRAVAAEIRLPAFAIGGITRQNLPEVLAAGFTRIAVGGAVTESADPAAAAGALLSILTV